MERRQLVYFLAVAEHGSFTAAARAVHVAQPSLSQAMRALESEVGAALFRRGPGGTVMTPEGEAFVGPARLALRSLATAADAVRSVVELRTGLLEIISLPILAADPLAEFVGCFHRRHPNVRVRIATPDGNDVLGLVRNGTFEVGLTLGPVGSENGSVTIGEDLRVVALPPEEVSIAFGPEDAHAEEGCVVEARDLENIRLIVDPRMHASAKAMLAEHGVVAPVAVECFHREAIVPLVLAGAGAALLLPQSAERARRQGAVVCRVLPPMYRRAVLVHRPHDLTAAGAAFVEMITTLLGQHSEAGPGTPDSLT